MIFALVSDCEVHHYLLHEKEYLIGCKNADIILVNDKSISRKHAIIKIKGNSPVLADCGSKYGTSLNNVSLVVNVENVLKNGDKIKFGVFNSIYRFECYNLTTTCSGLNSINKRLLKKTIESCGSKLLSNWTDDCQLLTCENIKLTVKLMNTLIDNKPIVNLNYWKKVMEHIKLKKQLPKIENFQPEFDDKSINIDNTINLTNFNRKQLFKNKVFIFFNKTLEQQVKETIEKIGGKTIVFQTINLEEIKQLFKTTLKTNELLFINDNDNNFDNLQKFLNDNFQQRLILLNEIVLAILYGNCNKECNPKFNRIIEVFGNSNQVCSLGTQLAPETQDSLQTQLNTIREDIVIPESYDDYQQITDNDRGIVVKSETVTNNEQNVSYNEDNYTLSFDNSNEAGDNRKLFRDNRNNNIRSNNNLKRIGDNCRIFGDNCDINTKSNDNLQKICDNLRNFGDNCDNNMRSDDNLQRIGDNCQNFSDNCDNYIRSDDNLRKIGDNRQTFGDNYNDNPRNSDNLKKFGDNCANFNDNNLNFKVSCDNNQQSKDILNDNSNNDSITDDNDRFLSDNNSTVNISNKKRHLKSDNLTGKRIKMKTEDDKSDNNTRKVSNMDNPFRNIKIEYDNDNTRKRKCSSDNEDIKFIVPSRPSTSKRSKTFFNLSNRNITDNDNVNAVRSNDKENFTTSTQLYNDKSMISYEKFPNEISELSQISTSSSKRKSLSSSWLSKSNMSTIDVTIEDFDVNLREICVNFINTINIKRFPLKVGEIAKKELEIFTCNDGNVPFGNRKKFRKVCPIKPQNRILRTANFEECEDED